MYSENKSQKELKKLINAVYLASADIGKEVEEILDAARKKEIGKEKAVRILTKTISIIKESATKRGDAMTLKSLEVNVEDVVQEMIDSKDTPMVVQEVNKKRVLESRNGIAVGPVQPNQFFHGREVPMRLGYLPLSKIDLWLQNTRLDIHTKQFKTANGRDAYSEELIDIMRSIIPLPGIEEDEFEIESLARSIATNGIRKPPIVDVDGTLLDGNRRVTACHHIKNSEEFSTAQRASVDNILVYQLTEFATNEDRQAVIVSLNFEDDCKVPWPKYVKARQLYDEFQAALVSEPKANKARQDEIKREISKKFAMGPHLSLINKLILMVEWSNSFEEYHVNEKNEDEYQVQHNANENFEYFDELSTGQKSGGVAFTLMQDDSLKAISFDLLYQGKWPRFSAIRSIPEIADNADARARLIQAVDEKNIKEAKQHVDFAVAIVTGARAQRRQLDANTKIEQFVQWLKSLPVKDFKETVLPKNLLLLLDALTLVEGHVKNILSKESSDLDSNKG